MTTLSGPVARSGGPGEALPPEAVVVRMRDPLVRPVLDDLAAEYGRRYGADPGRVRRELATYPAEEFDAPHGCLLLLLRDGAAVAGGAYRRLDARTAELKRIWASPAHRRSGLARRVLAELETRARAAGYVRTYLTTGPRQPEARALYLAAGYTPGFDPQADPGTLERLPFSKDLRG